MATTPETLEVLKGIIKDTKGELVSNASSPFSFNPLAAHAMAVLMVCNRLIR